MSFWLDLAAAFCAAFCVAFATASLLARASFALDVPNWRSQHSRPIPRSGGIAIALGVFLSSVLWATILGYGSLWNNQTKWLCLSSAIMLVVGIYDDCCGMSAIKKLCAQVVSSVLFVVFAGAISEVGLPGGGRWELGWLGPIISVLWLLVCMNAVNFIDGADGLIAKSLVVGFAGVGGLALVVGLEVEAVLALLLSAAIWGFYWWNRPPAHIFMGDSGSQFLGMMIGGLTLISAPLVEQRLSLLIVPLVFLPILFDASLTVARRAIALRPFWRAHRSHLFQLALRSGMAPLTVSRIYLGLTLVSIASGAMMVAAPGPWHHLWVIPPLLAQGVWVWRVATLCRLRAVPWHDD